MTFTYAALFSVIQGRSIGPHQPPNKSIRMPGTNAGQRQAVAQVVGQPLDVVRLVDMSGWRLEGHVGGQP